MKTYTTPQVVVIGRTSELVLGKPNGRTLDSTNELFETSPSEGLLLGLDD